MDKIAIGITTYNRPDYFGQCLAGTVDHLLPLGARIYAYNDGSDASHRPAYQVVEQMLEGCVVFLPSPVNKGVAHAKNNLLKQMLEDGADWLFLLEDDIVPQGPEAVEGYIEAVQQSPWEHLNFAHHGAHNPSPLEIDGPITYWPNWVGAYSVFTRNAIEVGGFFDEGFLNCWEHVEHTLRLAGLGLTAPRKMGAADATGSEEWLTEIPGSIEHSSIRPRGDWENNIREGKRHWKATKPETFRLIWPSGD